MFDAIQFSGDQFEEEIYVPMPSLTQLEVWMALKRLCFNENRFDGPFLEGTVSKTSLDIGLMSLNGQHKIAYEVDGPDHDEERDKRRDTFLKLQRGWIVYRVKVEFVDSFGYEEIAKMIISHFMHKIGMTKAKAWSPSVIESYIDVH